MRGLSSEYQKRMGTVSQMKPSVVPWQLGGNGAIDDYLRAGTAPIIEDYHHRPITAVISTQGKKQSFKEKVLRFTQRSKSKKAASKQSVTNRDPQNLIKKTSARTVPVTPGAINYEAKTAELEQKYKIGINDSFEDFPVFSPAPLERPPCRQGETIFDLENSLSNKINGFMHSVKEKYERAPIKITYDQRPPSRHKTPQRAVGLEFFRGSNKHSIDSLDFKMLDIESDESLHDKDELSFTTPLRKNSIDPAFLKKNKTSKRNDISSIQNNYRPAKHLSVVRPAKNAWEFDADVKSDRKNKMLTPKQPKTQFDEEDPKRYYKPTKAQELKIGVWNSNKRKSNDIPLIVNKREGFNSSYHSILEMDKPPEKPKRSENAPNLQESTRKRRSTNNMNIRTKSNPHKNRYAQNLAFNSTLEPEFLKLFAQDDVIS